MTNSEHTYDETHELPQGGRLAIDYGDLTGHEKYQAATSVNLAVNIIRAIETSGDVGE